MKFSKIKNIQLKQLDQFISFGLDKNCNLMVIKINSKYFPSSITLGVIKALLSDNNVVNNDSEQKVFTKLLDVLSLIRSSAGHGEHIFVVNKEKGNVDLVKD